ncbi:GDSL-like lipase/acylhydrolase family protein [Elsinoe australis]|uniref:GDSL-like lipase/acylhydrolase family protein n=1 Tax=Elsinoe australis TaxID=40998 RepID=A0A4U7BB94_9PEZI|nr:GDSL-like lipase/acylhydrolase family protein [Elsinoe australis]
MLFSTLLPLAFAAATTLASPLVSRQTSPFAGKNITLLPLGDSITYGFVDPNTNGYRKKLYNTLSAAGASPLDFLGSIKAGNFNDTDNEGRIGYTISQIATSAAAISNLRPNIVLLHAGTNDALRRYETSDKAIPRLAALIDQIYTQWPGVTLLVAKLVPAEEAAAQTYINDINAAIPGFVSTRAAAGKKILTVDMSTPKLTLTDLVDGIHPTVAGYEKMADIWLSGLTDAAAKGWLVSGGAASGSNAPAPTTSVRPAAPSSTTAAGPTTTVAPTTSSAAPAPAPTGAGTVGKYGQCGGKGYTGPTTCAEGSSCKSAGEWYSQCL